MIPHYIAPIPYTLADALLAEVFMMHYGTSGQASRRTISSGSCIYTVREPMGSKPGQIYLRQTSGDQTYIRLLGASDDELSLEMLLLYLWFLNDHAKHDAEDQPQIQSIEIIERSKSTYESWSRGAAYNRSSQAPSQTVRGLVHPEDKRAVQELQAHPEQREEIRQRWYRAVGRNKQRPLNAGSMGTTWRRLVARAKKAEK